MCHFRKSCGASANFNYKQILQRHPTKTLCRSRPSLSVIVFSSPQVGPDETLEFRRLASPPIQNPSRLRRALSHANAVCKVHFGNVRTGVQWPHLSHHDLLFEFSHMAQWARSVNPFWRLCTQLQSVHLCDNMRTGANHVCIWVACLWSLTGIHLSDCSSNKSDLLQLSWCSA